jgi:hypothetical protein
MTHHSCVVERIGTRAPGYVMTYTTEVGEAAQQSQNERSPFESGDFSTIHQVPRSLRECCLVRGLAGMSARQLASAGFALPLGADRVMPEMSIERGTLAIYQLAPFTCQRGPALPRVSP